MGAGAVDVALTVDHRDDSTSIRTKEQEHRTLEQKVLWGDPFDTQYPGPQTGGVLERFRSGGREGRDGLLWWHDLAHCQDGNFSISVMQANYVLEDQCLVESSACLLVPLLVSSTVMAALRLPVSYATTSFPTSEVRLEV